MPTLSEHYPLSFADSFDVRFNDNVLKDVFTNGRIDRRSLWPDASFRRSFKISHKRTIRSEEESVRSLFHRAGTMKSFWLRDNVNRQGNHDVFFTREITSAWNRIPVSIESNMDEVAVRRALPDKADIFTACGSYPVVWFDSQRETYCFSPVTGVVREDSAFDAATWIPIAKWQTATLYAPDTILTAYPNYSLTGGSWAKSSSVIAGIATGQPALTVFMIQSQANQSALQVCFTVGNEGSGACVGYSMSSANNWQPWQGGGDTMTGVASANGAVYKSHAVVYPLNSNTITHYVNGTSLGTATTSRTMGSAPIVSIGASPNGNSIVSNLGIAHAMVIPAALSQAQIKAIHNLLAYQSGMATV